MDNILEILLFVIIGGLCGILSCYLAEKLICDRVDDVEIKSGGTKYINPSARYIWAVVLSAAFVGICLTIPDYFTRVEYALVFCAAVCVAIVDFRIRRIPNQLLLFLLVLKVISTVVNIILNGFEVSMITGPLIGMVFAFVVYFIPSIFHLNIGAGDIKYGAVIGFYLGMFGFLQTMIVMGITMALYYIYLKVFKKGNLKTLIPNGPFMSVGVIITCLFPVVEEGLSSFGSNLL